MDCRICGKRIEKGERFFRAPSGKVRHRSCTRLMKVPSTVETRRSVMLTDDIHQANPVGFMVVPFKDGIDADTYFFTDEDEAKRCAEDQAQESFDDGNEWEDWPIYALWASEWDKSPPNEKGQP